MLHIGKYFGYVFHGAIKILFYPFKARKYIKNKENYSLEERYEWLSLKASDVLNNILRVKLDIKGLDKLSESENYLFTPNHQGMLDPVCLLSLLKKPTIFVCKKETKDYPIAGKLIDMVDAIYLDRESPRDALKMVKSSKDALLEGRNVVIFPEGTRSKDELVSIHEYKSGAFKCAYGTNVKIVPVVIDDSYLPLSTKRKNTDKIIHFRFLDPIDSETYSKMNTTELASLIENLAKKELEKLRNAN